MVWHQLWSASSVVTTRSASAAPGERSLTVTRAVREPAARAASRARVVAPAPPPRPRAGAGAPGAAPRGRARERPRGGAAGPRQPPQQAFGEGRLGGDHL